MSRIQTYREEFERECYHEKLREFVAVKTFQWMLEWKKTFAIGSYWTYTVTYHDDTLFTFTFNDVQSSVPWDNLKIRYANRVFGHYDLCEWTFPYSLMLRVFWIREQPLPEDLQRVIIPYLL